MHATFAGGVRVPNDVAKWVSSARACNAAALRLEQEATQEAIPERRERLREQASAARVNADNMEAGAESAALGNHHLAHTEARRWETSTAEGLTRSTRAHLLRRLRRELGRKSGPVRRSTRLHPGHDDGYRVDQPAMATIGDRLREYDLATGLSCWPDVDWNAAAAAAELMYRVDFAAAAGRGSEP